ncbi:MAG: glycogen debranching protein GlgX [Treponema sp.]|nr:glycogen debranching protein GlgX [Treponema sp.]
MEQLKVGCGRVMSPGAVITDSGVNFSIYSADASKITLCLFENKDAKLPFCSLDFDPEKNRTGNIWHIFVYGLKEGALYLYKADGEYNPPKGLRYNYHKYLFDPYAKAFTEGSVFRSYNNQMKSGLAGIQEGELMDLSDFPKCVVTDDFFDWEGDRPLNYPLEKCIIYETHLKGFTASESSGVEPSVAGTYAGFTKKIEYLKQLGITSVELLPVFEFDENENGNINPATGQPLVNYWGYSTIGFFAPKTSYASDKTPGGAVREFKQMVKQLHKAGIEVILDVVYNHTAEGNEHGYTFEWRGLQNDVYYQLPVNEKQYYMNFSGCGNTFNCNNPVVSDFILSSLRYWVLEMHVDGFRFDLASILTRAQNGAPVNDMPCLTEAISLDPVLAHTKIIAEPWDCGGLYQLGGFPAGDKNRWSEWNGRFRDDIRRFIRGDENTATAAATRVAGSSDCYNHSGKKVTASINFITAHDGFTLNDLVSYNYKHNEQNGEDNRDGSDDNLSYNHGFEGECSNPKINALRLRKIKNFLIYLFVSQGVPMMLGGDEMLRTQNGNNNAYCQDNDLSWIDWGLVQKNAGLVRFTSGLIKLRKAHEIFTRTRFFLGSSDKGTIPEINWYDMNAKNPDWSKQKRFLAFKLNGNPSVNDIHDNDFYVATNTDIYDLTITLPSLPEDKKWYLVADSSFESPEDIMEEGHEELLNEQRRYVLISGATVILISK